MRRTGLEDGSTLKHTVPTFTVGWEATCSCDAPIVPCVVLDPFAGSGTTLSVAKRLGRDAIGFELSPEYAKLAEKRIAETPDRQPQLF